jgi:hypothetical protein
MGNGETVPPRVASDDNLAGHRALNEYGARNRASICTRRGELRYATRDGSPYRLSDSFRLSGPPQVALGRVRLLLHCRSAVRLRGAATAEAETARIGIA